MPEPEIEPLESQWRWQVFSDVHVEGRASEPDGVLVSRVWDRHYQPLQHSKLPGDLANLHGATETDIFEFVRAWGLLGHRPLLGINRGEQQVSPPSHPAVTGHNEEPIAWVRAHARNAWLVLRLLIGLEHAHGFDGEDELEEVLVDEVLILREAPRDEWAMQHAALLADRIETILDDSPRWDTWVGSPRMYPRELAGRAIAAIISSNLAQVNVEVRSSGNGSISMDYGFTSLLESIYFQLGVNAADQTRTRTCGWVQCAWCAKFSQKTNARQRFCPPDRGRKESICAVKYNTDRIRRRREEVRKQRLSTSDSDKKGE